MLEYERAVALEAPAGQSSRLLADLAKAASRAGEHERAAEVARRVLATVNGLDLRDAHHAHAVLGIRALAVGDVAGARACLAAAAASGASFGAGEEFGPDFTLARALLARGEREAVIDYLVACKQLWRGYERDLDDWRQGIERGEVPSFRVGRRRALTLRPMGHASTLFPGARRQEDGE